MATARWTNFFKLLDSDKDGRIEPKDVSVIVAVIKYAKFYSENDLAAIQKALEDLIRNIINTGESTDEKVNLDQWLETGQNMAFGKAYETAPVWWNDTFAALFNAGDKYKNGVIGQEEFIELVTGVFPIKTISVTLAKAAYYQVEGELTAISFQEKSWAWASATSLALEDILLSLVLTVCCAFR
eukprot:Phypoly_transcript_20191.p1 GENE.Phypoly_transcript_20191~~Phypoly_transcript_20191.p1  ORF type:complete len:196 (+),score=31.73 Phypoly_transcript_20191:37-588(+)